MTTRQIRLVIAQYRAALDQRGVTPHADNNPGHDPLRHVHWMLGEMERLLQRGDDVGKINRWLGFCQGVLWLERIHSIDEMRAHNRAPK